MFWKILKWVGTVAVLVLAIGACFLVSQASPTTAPRDTVTPVPPDGEALPNKRFN